ncbi:MAG: hypothetical protein JW744_01450 [Candidatus Diapherotrites archaeon]|uniref:Uncharacterized protein n=1 Tax=Candidatus Iainarchaeum sp. TaxID=3101447 RepID=A0A939C8N1_9ARCH|nr:hypothetical protein [Candidatus Diapherotrites archaeon]
MAAAKAKKRTRLRIVTRLVSGKGPASRRAEAALRALRIARIRCKRNKKILKADILFSQFERAVEALEPDPIAIRKFRERQIPKIEASIEGLNNQIQEQVNKARAYTKAGQQEKARRAWRKDHELEQKRRARVRQLEIVKDMLM